MKDSVSGHVAPRRTQFGSYNIRSVPELIASSRVESVSVRLFPSCRAKITRAPRYRQASAGLELFDLACCYTPISGIRGSGEETTAAEVWAIPTLVNHHHSSTAETRLISVLIASVSVDHYSTYCLIRTVADIAGKPPISRPQFETFLSSIALVWRFQQCASECLSLLYDLAMPVVAATRSLSPTCFTFSLFASRTVS